MPDWFRIALTYTSNAIEGNTLSHAETAVIVNDGVTIGGKSMVEHQEALNHALAIDYIQKLAVTKKCAELAQEDILALHACILQKINSEYAGVFRTVAVRIMGSQVPRPNPLKVPELMRDFSDWLTTSSDHVALLAVQAHLKFVFIHPFIDGNGRTARLLFNLLLLQEGYPLVIVEKEQRMEYINAIEKALRDNNPGDFYRLMFQAIEKSLDVYLEAIDQSDMS